MTLSTQPPAASSRAAVLERFGQPVVVREFPLTDPPAGGLVVASRLGGICGTDLHIQRGHLAVPLPLVLGHEGLGNVHALGPGPRVDADGAPLRAGDRVMWASSIACGRCVPCRLHREPTLCEQRRTYGVNRPTTEDPPLSGSWAEHIVLREGTTVVRLPDGVDPLAAMSLACAGPTMVHALYERRPVRVGEVVVVQGSGPVGLAAAALAQLAGAARVILVGGPAQRLDLAARAGIGDVHVNIIDAAGVNPDANPGTNPSPGPANPGADPSRGPADPDRILADVVALTGGRGADLVIECTGVPAAVAQGLRMARRGGAYLVVGQYTDSGDTEINPHQIVYRQLDVIGSWAFSGAHLLEYVRLLPTLVSRFDLGSLVTTYPLADVATAMAEVARGAVMKAVLAT